MKNYILFFFAIIVGSSCNSEQASNENIPESTIPSFDLDYQAEMVAPGVISKASFEGHASINPEGNEIYFTVYSNDHAYSTIAYSVQQEGQWQEPEIVSFSGKYRDGSPALSPVGNKIYFSSNRPKEGREVNASNDIWVSERNEAGTWSNPTRLSDAVNGPHNEFSPSVDAAGNLYFCSNRPGGYGDMDVYFSKYENETYLPAELMSTAINSSYHEGNVGVSPDGNLLFLMIQHKPGDYGYDDIHYSIKHEGVWSPVLNVGTVINTPTYDFSPKVSPNGRTLFFSSRLNRDYNSPDSAYTYASFQNHLNSPLNGLGNIYRIELDQLKLIYNDEPVE